MMIPSLLLLAAVAIAGWLAGALVLSPAHRLANRLMAALVISVALIVLNNIAEWNGVTNRFPALIGFTWPLWFLIGPLFFLYVRELTRASDKAGYEHLVHFFPMLLSIVGTMRFYMLPGDRKIAIVEEIVTTTDIFSVMMNIVPLVHLALYVWLGSRRISVFASEYKLRSSSDGIIALESIRRVTLPFVAYIVIGIPKLVFLEFYPDHLRVFQVIGAGALSMFMIAIGYSASRVSRRNLFAPEVLYPEKYARGQIDEKEAERLAEKLDELMTRRQMYLSANIGLYDLADELKTTTHTLSQFLNQNLNTNFYEYINGFRVEHAKTRLLDPSCEQYTVLAIGEESGFSSKASFNRVFKRLTGMTPTQFQRSEKMTARPRERAV